VAKAGEKAIVVLTSVGTPAEAERIAHHLVERRLAACVSLVPRIRSIYRWEGEVQDDAEVLMISKTLAGRFEALAACIRELHSYDVPEIVALPAAAVERAYAAWLRDSV